MLGYYLRLSIRSLRRNVTPTALIILAIGVGIGTSMTTLAIFRTAAGDPIPERSAQLFTPQIDNCGPHCLLIPPVPADRMPSLLTYRDAVALLKLPIADNQAAMYAVGLAVTPADGRMYPVQILGHATGAAFFTMFEVPFEYGAAWSSEDDNRRDPVVVLTHRLNEKLFRGANSVGQALRIDSTDYRIVGVMKPWQPIPRFYDLSGGSIGLSDDAYIPFTRAVDAKMMPGSFINCSGPQAPASGSDSFTPLLNAECNWVEFWVDLPNAAAVRHYRDMLMAYAIQQRASGRFRWPARVQLRDVAQWLRYQNVVPTQVRAAVIVSLGLLAGCLINAMGLILARFLPRAHDFSVRQAVGATRGAIFMQSLVEVALIGVAGATVGLALTAAGLRVSRALLPSQLLDLIRFDSTDVGLAVLLSISASILAGLYPTWRTTRVQPAFQLKTQ